LIKDLGFNPFVSPSIEEEETNFNPFAPAYEIDEDDLPENEDLKLPAPSNS
jgi:hypothetical protein